MPGWAMVWIGVAAWSGSGGLGNAESAGAVAVGTVAAHPGEVVELPVLVSVDDPLRSFVLYVSHDATRLELTGFSVAGSEAEALDPSSILWHDFGGGVGFVGLAPLRASVLDFRVPAGDDRHVGWLRFRVRAAAPVGEAEVRLEEMVPSADGPSTLVLDRSASGGPDDVGVTPERYLPGGVEVQPPRGPRPVAGLRCEQRLDRVRLSFEVVEACDRIRVLRDGELRATLTPDSTEWEEEVPGVREVRYRVETVRGGDVSVAVACELRTVEPAAPVVEELRCGPAGLTWSNPVAYSFIRIHRNQALVAVLPGDATSWSYPERPSTLTVYSVVGVEASHRGPATSCIDRGPWILEAGDVLVEPGETVVTVPIYATNPVAIQGVEAYLDMSLEGLRLIDDEAAALAGAAGHPDVEFFRQGLGSAHPGCPAAGLVWDFWPPADPEKDLPPGIRQKVMSFRFEIDPDWTSTEVVRVGFREGFFTVRTGPLEVLSQSCDLLLPGEIRFADEGSKPGAGPVRGLRVAVEADSETGDGAGGSDGAAAVRLGWTNGGDYRAIRVDRNGETVAEIDGRRTSWVDEAVEGGVHTYKVRGVLEGRGGFPATALVSTARPPGAFLRGDADRDGRITVSDAVMTLDLLFRGGRAVPCVDAADTDDSGDISVHDPLATLSYLFRGGRAPVAPGVHCPWFDPTPDTLGCSDE